MRAPDLSPGAAYVASFSLVVATHHLSDFAFLPHWSS